MTAVQSAETLPAVPLGVIVYRSQAGMAGCESVSQRTSSERFWRTLGKKIAAGSRIPDGRL